MEYTKHTDHERLIDDPDISYELSRLSLNQAYVILNRDADFGRTDIVPVSLGDHDLFKFVLYRNFSLRDSEETTTVRTDRMQIEEGYIIYNIRTQQISFANIHRVDGDNFSYQIKYVHRDVGERLFMPQMVVYEGDDSMEITMKLDQDMNILQVYNETVSPVTREVGTLGVCPVGASRSIVDVQGETLVGSKNLDVMTALAYILSNELTLLRRIGDLMEAQGLFASYTIY